MKYKGGGRVKKTAWLVNQLAVRGLPVDDDTVRMAALLLTEAFGPGREPWRSGKAPTVAGGGDTQ